jgi:hypothetical protein
MSLITIEEYKEFIDEHPEMEQFYDFSREALDYLFENTIEEH